MSTLCHFFVDNPIDQLSPCSRSMSAFVAVLCFIGSNAVSQNPEKKAFVDNIFSVLFFMVGFDQYYISFQNRPVGKILNSANKASIYILGWGDIFLLIIFETIPFLKFIVLLKFYSRA